MAGEKYSLSASQQTATDCRLSRWLAGEGQGAACPVFVRAVTVRERGGAVRVDAIRVG